MFIVYNNFFACGPLAGQTTVNESSITIGTEPYASMHRFFNGQHG